MLKFPKSKKSHNRSSSVKKFLDQSRNLTKRKSQSVIGTEAFINEIKAKFIENDAINAKSDKRIIKSRFYGTKTPITMEFPKVFLSYSKHS